MYSFTIVGILRTTAVATAHACAFEAFLDAATTPCFASFVGTTTF